MLYIVSTPIGNLSDISLRAIETLKKVDLIACEDTRHSRILLGHYGVNTPTTSYFQYNRLRKTEYLVRLLKEGKDIALISDAGTPGILDPGFHIISSCIKENIPMTIVPGPTALIAALVLSGKPAHRFIFEGFLPKKSQALRQVLKRLLSCGYTVICYESGHRIVKTLQEIANLAAEKEIVVLRELTKKFEEVLRGRPSFILERIKKNQPRGEFVIVF